MQNGQFSDARGNPLALVDELVDEAAQVGNATAVCATVDDTQDGLAGNELAADGHAERCLLDLTFDRRAQ